ncbi:large ribosomal subunit protein uL23m [Culicoides brevitarsis]|uniref:large ribosomal subunit protein uL23m n=1 Tax=Culicoides brevitarsis TaxID=469753 RepID=UPI00307B9121
MSSRLYPLYKAGNPQLRVFLPNFWMKIVRPAHDQPPNVVTFSCSMEMTKHDIKNYLEKIYEVPVKRVRTRIALGKVRRQQGVGTIIKDDDEKLAYVTLPRDMKFEFPDIFPEKKMTEQRSEESKAIRDMNDNYKKYVETKKDRKNLPGWFSY